MNLGILDNDVIDELEKNTPLLLTQANLDTYEQYWLHASTYLNNNEYATDAFMQPLSRGDIVYHFSGSPGIAQVVGSNGRAVRCLIKKMTYNQKTCMGEEVITEVSFARKTIVKIDMSFIREAVKKGLK